jgi:hypothetical protein
MEVIRDGGSGGGGGGGNLHIGTNVDIDALKFGYLSLERGTRL